MDIRQYVTMDGRLPVSEWIDALRDARARERILLRIERLAAGLRGDWKPIGSGLFELRIDVGAGYRLYCGQRGTSWVLLLCGGDKRQQRTDIEKAHEYWKDHQARERPISRRGSPA